MDGIFELLRGISSLDAAERIGLRISGRRAGKGWACCPLHGEKTPSLCLFEDPARGWVCYGCHRGGDSVKLYSEYYHEDALTAARHLAEDFGVALPSGGGDVPRKPPGPTVYDLQRALEAYRREEYDKYIEVLRLCDAILSRAKRGDKVWEDKRFTKALAARSAAEQRLDFLHSATLAEIAEDYKAQKNQAVEKHE